MKIIPQQNYILIKERDNSEKMHGRLVVPDNGDKKLMMGTIIAVGEGVEGFRGFIPTKLKPGQVVTFPSFGGQKLTIDGDEYLIYKEPEIFAVLEEGEINN